MSDPYYIVAVWWPKDGSYGGASRKFTTLEETDEEIEFLKRLNCGNNDNPIHVIKVTPDEVVKVIDSGTPTPRLSQK